MRVRFRVGWGRQLCAVGLLVALGLHGRPAGAQRDAMDDEEAFERAIARSHAQSFLYAEGSAPFQMKAEGKTQLALRAAGRFSFDKAWADPMHWRDGIRFADFTGSSMRNDDGHYWTMQSEAFTPIRAGEALRFLSFELPSGSHAASFFVTETSETSGEGLPVSCFASNLAPFPDHFPRKYKWCFDKAEGLLRSADMPIGMHLVFTDYVRLNGKQVYTHVTATASGLLVLDAAIAYSALAPDALAHLVADPAMQRHDEANEAAVQAIHYQPAVEEARAVLPKGAALSKAAAQADAGGTVALRFVVGVEGRPVDAAVEQAPDAAMGQAALEAAHGFRFQPMMNETAAGTHIFHSVAFAAAASGAETGGERIQLGQLREVFAAIGLHEEMERMAKKEALVEKGKLQPWWPLELLEQVEEAGAQVDPAPLDLPFFQQCYSERDGHFLVDVVRSPGGRDWMRYVLGFSLDEQLAKHVTPPEGVADATARKPPEDVVLPLNAEDLAYEREVMTPQRVAALQACMAGVSAKAVAAVDAAQGEAVTAALQAHKPEIDAAYRAYKAQQKGSAAPQ